MIAVFKREFKSYFTTPIGYVVMAILFAVSGFFFFGVNLNGGSVNLKGVYTILFYIVILVGAPLLTMRSFSEEKRQRTDQALLTAPISLTGIVIGKFLAAMLLVALTLCITLVYAIVIATQVTPDWMVIFGNSVGLLLLSGIVIAAGLLFSCCTESQIIAFLLAFVFSLVLLLIDGVATLFSSVTLLVDAVSFLSVSTRYTSFTNGLIHYDDIIFFLSMQALFLFLTVRVLDRKRWG